MKNYKEKLKEIQKEVLDILEEKVENFDSLSVEEQIKIETILNDINQRQKEHILKKYEKLLNIENLNSEQLEIFEKKQKTYY